MIAKAARDAEQPAETPGRLAALAESVRRFREDVSDTWLSPGGGRASRAGPPVPWEDVKRDLGL